jgi:hypothetical protein
MKTCSYCGRENTNEAVQCAECGTDEFKVTATPAPPDENTQKEWVTLTKCRNLVDADVLASQLDAAGIKVFMPDEFVMQTFSLDSNGFGFARVQMAPADFEQAKEILSSPTSVLPPAATPPPVPGPEI